ncbi:MAG: hypothetical protein JST40_09280 [Armatimonadetes bacterium]|nr:hypothetical protein [Armatimonadota bacterium]
MRVLVLTLAVVAASHAVAQTPDFALRIDMRLHQTSTTGGNTRLRWYDPMGRHSTVGFGLNLEPGYYVLVTERLQRVRGDIDQESIDEAYVENPGQWRLGRQYLPFGGRGIVREAALAARLDAGFRKAGLPIVLTGFDNGADKLRGVLVRIGGRTGISAAVGSHMAAASTSMGAFRSPEDSPGPKRGYRLVGAIDTTVPWGPVFIRGEYVALRRPNQETFDKALDLTDISLTYQTDEGSVTTSFAWARNWTEKSDFYRIENELKLTKNLSLRSFVRFNRGQWRDFSAGIRVRI